MNSTTKGNALENSIFEYFHNLIEIGDFFGGMKFCKIFQKKGYYSRDRETEIIFDVSIEAYLPGSSNYIVLFLIECKNYGHPVPVSDVEEFFTKVQQVGAANSKAILISSNSIQTGGLAFAKSKGMGVARYYDPQTLKWQLDRSSSYSFQEKYSSNSFNIISALSQESQGSSIFDFHLQTAKRPTNSIAVFFEDLCEDFNLEGFSEDFWPPIKQQPSLVPFQSKNDLELQAARVLEYIKYEQGCVDLQELICKHPAMTGLQLKHTEIESPVGSGAPLGRIEFKPLTIEIFIYPDRNIGRERFTFAHELAHLLLGHGRVMRREYTEEKDFNPPKSLIKEESDIFRMEYQANYFAACLLMPRKSFVEHFMRGLRLLELHNKGFGALYVDTQDCNVQNYLAITGVLMQIYQTSRMAVTIRAKELGLLRDDRNSFSSLKRLVESENGFQWLGREVD
ncbi:ImmA/IrrE family metallo-endopeptidase [Acidovorax sp. Root217]|uniref:ImmA/IrrE family metallo-endopeptidase n=1 Tax=Acidovorax sp. Root217 TaxID=1736492 RepID=UPI0009E84A4A|nr:ImmA/IrrE family metallo-endopeptidase [Acidovorax sp. Root217]